MKKVDPSQLDPDNPGQMLWLQHVHRLGAGITIGDVVTYEWKGTRGVFIVVSKPDDTGHVGLAALQENVRAHLDDLEEV